MRVLGLGSVYPPHFLGGHELLWQAVDRELRARGHEARALTTGFRRAGIDPEAGADDPHVVRALRWYWRDHGWPRIGWRERLSIERHNARALAEQLAAFQPDVAALWPMGGMSLSLIEQLRRAGVPLVLFVHDYWLAYAPVRDRWTAAFTRRPRLARAAERLTGIPARLDLARAGRYLFNSRVVEQHARGLGLQIEDGAVLSPGVDLATFAPAAPRPWGWALLYAGRIVEPKGIDTAIEALAMLPQEARLRIVGEGDRALVDELRARAERLGIAASRVVFEQPVDRTVLAGCYAQSDAVLFPVRWDEPWGLVPLEAMAVGRPVVATGRGGSGDYLRDGSNALLFAAGDGHGLADALRRLAGDGELRERLRVAGLATAAAHDAQRFLDGAINELELAAARRRTN